MNDVADLVHLHQHLRRVGRDDQHVRMGLHEQASVALVGLAQVLARFHRLGKTLFQSVGLGDADAIGAMAAEIRQPAGERLLQTVHRFRNHLTERELAGTLRSRKDYGVREVFARQHLAQGVDHIGIAMKIGERH